MAGVHRGATYADLILAARRRYPDEPVDRTGQLVEAVIGAGVERGEGVALLATGNPHASAATAAALAAGARVSALHPLASADDQAFVLDDAEISTLVYDPVHLGDRAADLASRVPRVERLLALGPSADAPDLIELADRLPACRPRSLAEEGDLAFVHYTGGTTGRPKGVAVSHAAMVHGALMVLAEWDWPAEVRFLACTQMAQVLLVPVRLLGGSVHYSMFDPELVLRTIERERITCMYLVPSMIYALLDHPGIGDADLSSVESIFYGASTIAPARLEEALETFGPVMCQIYASTEATHTVTVLPKRDHDPAVPGRLESCGRPAAALDVEVHDEDGRALAPGEVGEVAVRGRSLMEGYWRRPELTAAALRGGWYRTGDVAFQDERGFVTIIDRRGDAIIRNGFNVYPREVESVLASHPAVLHAAVFGVPDGTAGEEVMAAVVPRAGAHVSVDDLARLVHERKGVRYVPGAIEVVGAIAATPSGKPDRRRLRELAAAAKPERAAAAEPEQAEPERAAAAARPEPA
ncbi:MAG TPA: AMP-binding protein [Thermoleophilaceae bacterium]